MDTYYTNERNIQMLIVLMKSHNVKRIVASPGTTDVSLVASLQQDSYFEMYSSVDERSAAYLACGMAADSGEPVAIICTGATASRNYVSGLTEAFYRKLPILAITTTQHIGRIGQNIPQVLDRSQPLKDTAKLSVQVPSIHSSDDEWACNIAINRALLELRHHGGGPVHINLATNYSRDFYVKKLPTERVIRRYTYGEELPKLNESSVCVYVGAHSKWTREQELALNDFCKANNGVVLSDRISNYYGKYRVPASLVCNQDSYKSEVLTVPLMVYIGNVSDNLPIHPKRVWRVNPDGEIRDTFGNLEAVFEMSEEYFFKQYASVRSDIVNSNENLKKWNSECKKLSSKITELPFSNAWIAQQTLKKLPENSTLHLGILNSLRSWNFFEPSFNILGYSNTGGFGIDGNVSAFMGASFIRSNELFFGVFGDLSFFYDLNVNGNRHVGNNVRLLVVNNGKGAEFKNYNNVAAQFGAAADSYIAAGGHFGRQSPKLIKNFAEDLGFEYIKANSKEEYLQNLGRFVKSEPNEKPMIFEVFTNTDDESDALKMMRNLEVPSSAIVKKAAKRFIGERGVQTLKKIIRR